MTAAAIINDVVTAPPELAGFLPAWDIDRRRADVGRLVSWMLSEMPSSVRRLEDIHHVLDAPAARAMARHLTHASTSREPRTALHELVRRALPELPWDAIAIQASAHVRILVPNDHVSPVPLHSDFAIGHALDERNLWIALTPARAREQSALRVATFSASLASDRESATIHAATAIDVDRGDILLFTPLHVHGASIVVGDATRVSIDVRILPLTSARARNPFAYIPLEGSDE